MPTGSWACLEQCSSSSSRLFGSRAAFGFRFSLPTIFLGLLLLLLLRCKGDVPREPRHDQRPSTCGQAQTQALQFALSSHYEEALSRYEDALGLCRNDKKTVFHLLNGIASIASLDSSRCSRARELFHLVSESQDIIFLRYRSWLHYSCGESGSGSFEQLVATETRLFEPAGAPLMPELVVHYEHATLYFLTRKPTDHLHSLEMATQTLCNERMLSKTINIMRIGDDRQSNPAWGILGYWSMLPPESIDNRVRSCLAGIAGEIQGAIDSFSGVNKEAARTWLRWRQTRLAKQ